MEPSKLISLSEFQRIRFIAAKIATVKANKAARVPAYLCSLDVGTALLEVRDCNASTDRLGSSISSASHMDAAILLQLGALTGCSCFDA